MPHLPPSTPLLPSHTSEPPVPCSRSVHFCSCWFLWLLPQGRGGGRHFTIPVLRGWIWGLGGPGESRGRGDGGPRLAGLPRFSPSHVPRGRPRPRDLSSRILMPRHCIYRWGSQGPRCICGTSSSNAPVFMGPRPGSRSLGEPRIDHDGLAPPLHGNGNHEMK